MSADRIIRYTYVWAIPDDDVSWRTDAACADIPLSVVDQIFFPKQGGTTHQAKAVCARCPVRAECLAWAVADPDLAGVWGGTSARERRRLRVSGYVSYGPEDSS